MALVGIGQAVTTCRPAYWPTRYCLVALIQFPMNRSSQHKPPPPILPPLLAVSKRPRIEWAMETELPSHLLRWSLQVRVEAHWWGGVGVACTAAAVPVLWINRGLQSPGLSIRNLLLTPKSHNTYSDQGLTSTRQMLACSDSYSVVAKTTSDFPECKPQLPFSGMGGVTWIQSVLF